MKKKSIQEQYCQNLFSRVRKGYVVKKETKAKMFEFVLSYLKSNDVEHLNFSLISKKTGISRTTIYSYYEHIQELLEDIIADYMIPLEKTIKKHAKNIHDVFSCYENDKKVLEFIFQNRHFFLVEEKMKHNKQMPDFVDDMTRRMTETIVNQTKKEYIEQYYFMGLTNIFTSWKNEGFNYAGLDRCAKAMTFYTYSVLKEKS